MSLEDIIFFSLNRRDLLIYAGATGTSLIFGCGKEKKIIGTREKSPQPPSVPIKEDPPGDYTQFSIPKYSVAAVSGSAKMNIEGRQIWFVDQNDNLVNGLDVHTYKNSRDLIVVASDPSGRTTHGVLVFSGRGASKITAQQSGIYKLKMYAKQALEKGKNLLSKKLEDAIVVEPGAAPLWNADHVINIPGITYKGDWSFNQFVALNSSLSKSSANLAVIASDIPVIGPTTSELLTFINVATNEVGIIANYADELIDIVNKHTKLKIDKNYRLSWYRLPIPFPRILPHLPTVGDVLIPTELVDAWKQRNLVFNISEYLPLNPGNKWMYAAELFERLGGIPFRNIEESSVGTMDIKGKKVIVLSGKNEGREYKEYYGYKDGELKLMGAYDRDIGDFYFEPGLILGDSALRIGRSYNTKSNVVLPQFPNIKGIVSGTFGYEGLEQVSTRAGEFGDCLRVKETVELNLLNISNNESIQTKEVVYHWLARHVGQTRIRIEEGGSLLSGTYKLQQAEVNGIRLPKPAYPNEEFSFGVIEAVKNAYLDIV